MGVFITDENGKLIQVAGNGNYSSYSKVVEVNINTFTKEIIIDGLDCEADGGSYYFELFVSHGDISEQNIKMIINNNQYENVGDFLSGSYYNTALMGFTYTPGSTFGGSDYHNSYDEENFVIGLSGRLYSTITGKLTVPNKKDTGITISTVVMESKCVAYGNTIAVYELGGVSPFFTNVKSIKFVNDGYFNMGTTVKIYRR